MKHVSERIAVNVKRLRLGRALSQYRLADRVTEIGPSKFRQPQVSDIERAKSPQITVETLEKLATALDCSLDALVRDQETAAENGMITGSEADLSLPSR